MIVEHTLKERKKERDNNNRFSENFATFWSTTKKSRKLSDTRPDRRQFSPPIGRHKLSKLILEIRKISPLCECLLTSNYRFIRPPEVLSVSRSQHHKRRMSGKLPYGNFPDFPTPWFPASIWASWMLEVFPLTK